MSFPKLMVAQLSTYLAKNWMLGKKRFPMAMMLEPIERCNLTCAGCGRVREYRDCLDKILSVEECLSAIDRAGVPVVCISGGEPLLHPDIEKIVGGLVARHKFIHFCTNGLLLKKMLNKFKPGPYMSFVLHMDGLAETHNRGAGRDGVFETAIEAIKAAKQRGFRVYTNTTIFRKTKFTEVEALFTFLSGIGVDAFMIAPAFDFKIVGSDIFMSRDEIVRAFKPLESLRQRFQFYNTPAYLDFLLGKKTVECMPWGTPTLTPKGWRKPCYLLADEHCGSYDELMEATDWEKYGVGKDDRCANCMVHSGFEASLVDHARHNLPELLQLAKGS